MRIGFTGCLVVLWAGCLGAQPASVRPEEETPSVTAVERPDPEGVDFMVDGIPFNAEGFVVRGTRVRVQSSEFPGWSYVGRILEIDDESVLLGLPGGARPLRLKRPHITRMGVSLGRHRRGKEGAKIGATILGVLGAAAGAVLGNFDSSDSNTRNHLLPVAGAIAGGVLGVGVGATGGWLTGSALTTESWRPVASSRISARIGPKRGGGLGASLALSF